MSHILEKVETLHCDENDDASTCVDNVGVFLEYTMAAAKHLDLRLSRVHHTLSMCEPCLVENDEENCEVTPFTSSHEDTTCRYIKQHLMGTFDIAEGFEVSASEAYEAFSMESFTFSLACSV